MDIGPELASQVFSSTAKKVPMEQKEPRLFDEAKSILFKEPLPYWVGFSKQYTKPEDESNVKLPRYYLFCLVFVFFFFRKCRKAILGCLPLTTLVRKSYFKA